MNEIVGDHDHRVKRLSSGDRALRWAAAGTTPARAQFRRIKGCRQLPELDAMERRPR